VSGRITLSHGSGGEESSELISKLIFANIGNEIVLKNEDAAVLSVGKNIAFTTDSYTVSPLFFEGGDIGKLSICGSCNDLAMMGAKPLYISLAFIIEEGFLMDDLEKILISIKKELEINGAKVVCGDTKVVPRGACDGIFINTSAIGEIIEGGISSNGIKDGASVIFSGSVGDHGATVFAARSGINIKGALKSDSASLYPAVEELLKNDIKPMAMRDATRGGLAAVLNEWCRQSNIGFVIDEPAINIKDSVYGLCEVLGFEAWNLANEGAFVMAIDEDSVEKSLEILKSFEFSKSAALIGRATKMPSPRVELKSSYGTKRLLDYPSGELLPRIC